MPISQAPAFNLKVVLKETGIAADTLRAWERRYGLPRPQRTAGGHRLYSQHDIHLIKWLMARQAEGLSISRAVDLFQELTAGGQDLLAEEPPAAAASLEALREQWLAAALTFNEASADQVLNQAFALYPVEMVVTGLIQSALHKIGGLWQVGEASVQQEHFASSLAVRRVDALISASPPPTRAQTLLLACPPEEQHFFPLLLLSLLLRRRGWNVIYLGADVPLARLEATVKMLQPALVVMSAQGLGPAAALREAAFLLSKAGVPLAFGGRIFNQLPELREQIPANFTGESLHEAPAAIEKILEHPEPLPEPEAIPTNFLAETYQSRRPLIEAALRTELQPLISAGNLDAALLHFGRTLQAALRLGQVAYLRADLDWLKGLSIGEGRPADSLSAFLTAYSAALRRSLGPEGEPVAEWLDGYASRS